MWTIEFIAELIFVFISLAFLIYNSIYRKGIEKGKNEMGLRLPIFIQAVFDLNLIISVVMFISAISLIIISALGSIIV